MTTTNSTLSLGTNSRVRGFFEEDEEFEGPPDLIESLLSAYESAAENAFLTARFALLNPDRRDQAIWAEASASTLEWVLYRYAVHNKPDGLEDMSPWRMK
ncbi:hypothetical protein IB236_13085 [Acidovorax sp. ACV02]|uniref:hypothetical protein n=1 Tax=Acidovorax sp. ACV02 TaxID=2769310 RepID=UPI0017825E3A|nr:hypothetical protein [Acidovorax sp. ACV02]MBD9406276.1 hypothetical protein [Acidovorax sp. ACV02]